MSARGRHAIARGAIARGAIARGAIAVVALGAAAPARADGGDDGPALAAVAWLNAPGNGERGLRDAVALTASPLVHGGLRARDRRCRRVLAAGRADRDHLAPVLTCIHAAAAPLLARDATWTVITADAVPPVLRRHRAALRALAADHALVLAHARTDHAEDWAVIAVAAAPTPAVAAIYAAHRP